MTRAGSPLERRFPYWSSWRTGPAAWCGVDWPGGGPDQGAVRASVDDGNGVLPSILYAQKWGGREAACVDATPVWDVTSESKDCNAISLF